MYFTNLTNEELQLYHKITSLDSVSLDLTLMQESSLFNITNLGNNIYKIIPLFYVDEITCNEDNVKILDNKCIILQEQTNPTFINFITNNATNSSYIWDDTYRKDSATPLPIVDPSDDITMPQFNNLIQVLRDNVPFYDNIKIKNGVINGLYGDYTFNITDATIIDTGILISEETIANDLTVRLNNQLFEYSTYTLTLDVVSINDINLLNDYDSDNITHTSLDVTLTPNEAVTIPLTDLDFNTVIDFDAKVRISHDKAYLTYTDHLNLMIGTTGYAYDEVTLQATYDTSGTPKPGETITFYDGETSLGTATTDSSGIATLYYTPTQSDKYYNFQAKSSTVNSTIKQTYLAVMNPTLISAIRMVNSNCPNTLPNSASYTGFVTVGDRGLYPMEVECRISKNSSVISTSTVETHTDGSFRGEVAISETGELTFDIYFPPVIVDGETFINGVNGATKTATMSNKLNTSITVVSSSSSCDATIVDSNSNPVSNVPLTFKSRSQGQTHTIGTATTNNNGVATLQGYYPGIITVSFEGNCNYNSSTGSNA